MKNSIIKFLGLDKIQQENANLQSQVAKLQQRLDVYDKTDFNSIAKDSIDYDDLAQSVDNYDLAHNIDAGDVAYHIDMCDLAGYVDHESLAEHMDIDLYSLAEHIDYGTLQEKMTDAIDMDILAQTVSEKIADRDGMHQLISEEIENQGVGNISTDAVQSMIDTAIQQFADSLEVMVSAKLNINK
jgi:hypothetical protein